MISIETVKALPSVPLSPSLSNRARKAYHSKVREDSRRVKVCAKCGSTENLHKHHITYRRKAGGEMFDKLFLCFECHAIITGLNTIYARNLGCKLSNKQRKFLFWDIFFTNSFEPGEELKLGISRFKTKKGVSRENRLGSVVDGQQPNGKTSLTPTKLKMSSPETPVQVNRSI